MVGLVKKKKNSISLVASLEDISRVYITPEGNVRKVNDECDMCNSVRVLAIGH